MVLASVLLHLAAPCPASKILGQAATQVDKEITSCSPFGCATSSSVLSELKGLGWELLIPMSVPIHFSEFPKSSVLVAQFAGTAVGVPPFGFIDGFGQEL